MGMLFRFHGSFEYWFIGCVSSVGIALVGDTSELNEQRTTVPYLPWVVECTSAPYSTSTVSFCEETSLQNSFSTSSSETTRSLPILVVVESSSAWSPGGWAANHIRRNSLSRA